MGFPIPIIGELIDEIGAAARQVLPNKEAEREFELKLADIRDRVEARVHEQVMGQVEVNKVEASHRSIWVAGWRPFVGWVAGCGIAWTFVIAPLVEWVSRLWGWTGEMPEVDVAQLMTLVLAMLGVAGMRSFDKVKGTADDTPLGRTVIEQRTVEATTATLPAPPRKKRRGFRIGL
jgi:hypothetical protein